ncbi:MAG TPA: dTDP-4-dehydrorhamnose 3,5-epimerase [Candidatus Onthomorpha intestinigallinarum]|uniref:dTDP-4-dehydrorhamnose 3,5-epimerase n=1 Tax=Candidatus Onthomorpha intestinigallinarum TaxID=2840880 RepID=A0A9D1RI19_9BACT|nr:dTDP-4-dehydrorhamnose 3,5-epimerase [Candidatus Onthomorpha intestinigallinarum]
MEIRETKLSGLIILEPKVFGDERGSFMETYNRETFARLGLDMTFVQDNESVSAKGVLRGIHFQRPPFAQGKLVRVVSGRALDYAVDLRRNSPTYGQYACVELSGRNKRMMYLPEGFAHAFLSLEDDTVFNYKCTNFYNKQSEDGLLWSDKDLGIEWPVDNPILSEKDLRLGLFKDFVSPF